MLLDFHYVHNIAPIYHEFLKLVKVWILKMKKDLLTFVQGCGMACTWLSETGQSSLIFISPWVPFTSFVRLVSMGKKFHSFSIGWYYFSLWGSSRALSNWLWFSADLPVFILLFFFNLSKHEKRKKIASIFHDVVSFLFLFNNVR